MLFEYSDREYAEFALPEKRNPFHNRVLVFFIRKKMIKNLKAMLCESSLNFVISDCNYILNQDGNIFSLAIQLMYSISMHIEFNKSIRFDFLEIITNLLKIENSIIKSRKLEFIKEVCLSIVI